MPSRNDDGRHFSFLEVAEMIRDALRYEEMLTWNHVTLLATMYAESGLYEWIRPIVYDPPAPHHLSVDRGILQLNSYWWSHVPDDIAYDAPKAITYVMDWLREEADKGTQDAKPWKWSPLIDWQWHGYGTALYKSAYPHAYKAISQVRQDGGLSPL